MRLRVGASARRGLSLRERRVDGDAERVHRICAGQCALAGAYPVDTFRVAIDSALAKLKAAPR
jgi:hypothetical protein